MSAARKRRKRRTLLLRDGASCVYCGRQLGTGEPFSRLTFDHVVPVSRGGGNALTNLVLACKPCNRAKADQMLEDFAKAAA
jgi:5-methylcytosine-specific restriction endonuclease McrA